MTMRIAVLNLLALIAIGALTKPSQAAFGIVDTLTPIVASSTDAPRYTLFQFKSATLVDNEIGDIINVLDPAEPHTVQDEITVGVYLVVGTVTIEIERGECKERHVLEDGVVFGVTDEGGNTVSTTCAVGYYACCGCKVVKCKGEKDLCLARAWCVGNAYNNPGCFAGGKGSTSCTIGVGVCNNEPGCGPH